jgi:lysophospholipase L1-like esterase
MTLFPPNHPCFQYSGRMDDSDASAFRFYYAGSYLVTQFEGTSLTVVFDDMGDWWAEEGNKLGVILDKAPMVEISLQKGQANQKVQLASGLPDKIHSLLIAKLHGPGCGGNTLIFRGVILDNGKPLRSPAPKPMYKIEIYGDSVTEGTGAACPDGTHDCGSAGNHGWFSYANGLARLLRAEIHNVGIGGLAVRNGTGWYVDGAIGLETTYDKLRPWGDSMPSWDFSRYQPDLVIMAMGVNDQSKGGFADLPLWMNTYKAIVRDIHTRYRGGALPFVFAVAPINAHEAYRNVAQVAAELHAEGINTFFFRYGFEVDGHPNVVQSARMAQELHQFITEQKLLP